MLKFEVVYISHRYLKKIKENCYIDPLFTKVTQDKSSFTSECQHVIPTTANLMSFGDGQQLRVSIFFYQQTGGAGDQILDLVGKKTLTPLCGRIYKRSIWVAPRNCQCGLQISPNKF